MRRARVPTAHQGDDLHASLAFLRTDPSAARASRAVVDRLLATDKAYYGINTGFGALKSKHVPAGDLSKLMLKGGTALSNPDN